MSEHQATMHLIRLIEEFSQGIISSQRAVELDELLKKDAAARTTYLEYMLVHYGLLRHLKSSHDLTNNASSADCDLILFNQTLQELAAAESSAPTVEVFDAVETSKAELVRKVQKQRLVPTVNKTSLLIAAASMAALILLAAYVYVSGPAPYEVATVSDSIEAKWSSDLSVKAGNRMKAYSKPIQLTEGIVKLITDEGVEVVLEAPSQFRFISYSEIALDYGKLFAHVGQQGYGFCVATPNARVVDLGTEFGVLAQIDGNTEVHMYTGRANLFAGQKTASKVSELLAAGKAMKVSRNDSMIGSIVLQQDVVVRSIDSQKNFVWRGQHLNLADIVGGGSGFGTGRLDRGIDVSTGNVTDTLSRTDVFDGPKDYVPVTSSAYIDGVFAVGPDGGSTQITSGGLQTDEFGTMSGQVWGYIFNGAWHLSHNTPRHPLQLDGVSMGDKENPAITMHSNLGITFDLSAIRQTLPGVRIRSFSSIFGVSQTVENWINFDFEGWQRTPEVENLAARRHSTAEFWVFLDGRKVLQQKVSSASKAGTMDIPIDQSVQFLTLAVTEADDTFMFDWSVFGRPQLNLELTDKQPASH